MARYHVRPMPRLTFTRQLGRFLPVPSVDAPGATVREVLEGAFAREPRLRGYITDDQGRLRQHVVVFVDGRVIADRVGLGDAVHEASEVHVMQALSGG